MSRNYLLIDFPSDVFGYICCKWLRLNEMTCFDAAVVKQGLRTDYLNLLRSVFFIFRRDFFCDPICSQLIWIWSRRIAVDALNLTPAVMMFSQLQDINQTHFVFSHLTEFGLTHTLSRDTIEFCIRIVERDDMAWVHCKILRMYGFNDCCKKLLHCLVPKLVNLTAVWVYNNDKSCSSLDDADVTVIACSCPRLTTLTVCHAPLLTGVGIKALADHSQMLTKLFLKGTRTIGDSLYLLGLSSFAANLEELTLDIRSYVQVKMVSVVCLFARMLKLVYVNLIGWRERSHEDQEALRVAMTEYCPLLCENACQSFSRSCEMIDCVDEHL
jgi:hypothetical protein